MGRRWCKALAGLWERRKNPVVREIVDDALRSTDDHIDREGRGKDDASIAWFGRLLPDEFTTPDNIQVVRKMIRQAVSSQRRIEGFLRDRQGRMLIVQVVPTIHDGKLQTLSLRARYPRYRLYQMVGESP